MENNTESGYKHTWRGQHKILKESKELKC